MTLYNMDLDTGDCVEHIAVLFNGRPLADVLAELAEVSTGLTDPSIDISHDDDPYRGFTSYTLAVTGHRKMTEAEIRNERSARDIERRRREHMARFRP